MREAQRKERSETYRQSVESLGRQMSTSEKGFKSRMTGERYRKDKSGVRILDTCSFSDLCILCSWSSSCQPAIVIPVYTYITSVHEEMQCKKFVHEQMKHSYMNRCDAKNSLIQRSVCMGRRDSFMRVFVFTYVMG